MDSESLPIMQQHLLAVPVFAPRSSTKICACSAASTSEEAVLIWDLHRVGSRWLVETVRSQLSIPDKGCL